MLGNYPSLLWGDLRVFGMCPLLLAAAGLLDCAAEEESTKCGWDSDVFRYRWCRSVTVRGAARDRLRYCVGEVQVA
jgi:hypothetical protein